MPIFDFSLEKKFYTKVTLKSNCKLLIRLLFLLLLVQLFPIESKAQLKTIPDSLKQTFTKNEFGITAPITSSGMRFIAKTAEGELYNVRFFYHRHVLSTPDALFYYASNFDLIYDLTFYNKRKAHFFKTWGIAIAPFGVKILYPHYKIIIPNMRLLGGFVWFDKAFPDQRGLHFNFTYELDLGLDWRISKQLKLTTNYTFFHHSNAEIGKVNPGMDNNMFVLGMSFGL